jgi:hypothetical protein
MSLIIDEITSSALSCSLFGAKRVLERQLRLKDVFYIFNNNKKSPLQRKKETKYPYAYFAFSSMRINKDSFNNKAIRRNGITDRGTNFASVNRVTNATINKYFLFPAEVCCEMHYFDDNISNIIKFTEAFLILGVTDCFNFSVRMNESAQWVSRIEIPDDSVTVPEYDLESAENPGASEIVMPFIIHTHLGFCRDVAKVRENSPSLTFSVGHGGEETEMIPSSVSGVTVKTEIENLNSARVNVAKHVTESRFYKNEDVDDD